MRARSIRHLSDNRSGHARSSPDRRDRARNRAAFARSRPDSPRWWTGSNARCYDRETIRSMKLESVVYAIAGVFFGLIAGWIIGSQQASMAPRASVARGADRAAAGVVRIACRARLRRRFSTKRRCRRSATSSIAIRRTPSRARSSETSTTMRPLHRRHQVVRRVARAQSEGRERQHRSRRELLLQQPARSRHQAARAFAADRSEAHEDAARTWASCARSASRI